MLAVFSGARFNPVMCVEYELDPMGDGWFKVFIRSPGGRQLYAITDNPMLYPRRFFDRPRADIRREEIPHMFPGYAGPVLPVLNGLSQTSSPFWGFTPHWSPKPLHNATQEKLTTSATWKKAFQTRRCLVPVTAYYEWHKPPDGGRKRRVRIKPTETGRFCFAGLWESFKGNDGEPLDTYTVVTTTPNDFLIGIHHRMLVILNEEAQERWIDPTNTTGEGLDNLLKPGRCSDARGRASRR